MASRFVTDMRDTAPERVDSNIIYQIQAEPDAYGSFIPVQLGEGRFAKVYKAWQRSDGQNLRQVAIKILHNTARYVDQNLFQQEIALLKELSAASMSHVVSVLDVVQLGPMIMCGCGKIYNPLCPQCGRFRLQGRDTDNKEYPSLACPDGQCGYSVSAMNIEMQYQKLTSAPAKVCCKEGPFASRGTIINFVNRPAVVMELQETRLDAFGETRRQEMQSRCESGAQESLNDRATQPVAKAPEGVRAQLRIAQGAWSSVLQSARAQQQVARRLRVQRTLALDKLMLMVQVAESVAWLHGEMGIIHKDLTPDNVMVNLAAEKLSKAPVKMKGRPSISVDEILRDCVSYPTSSIKVIDFGLSDRQKLSRKWYEEKDIINAGIDKAPYFSPEALQRIQRLNCRLEIDTERSRFVLPSELKDSNLSVHKGDILAFQWDINHEHDLTILHVEHDAKTQRSYAYFEGRPPPLHQQRQFQIILPLSEAHDIYSAGALFYYILTEKHLQVQRLASFVSVIQTHPCELTATELLRRHGDSYRVHRDAIPIPDPEWRDRVMELILRAMVRGRRDSFNACRSERGPESALSLLWETKRIYRGYQEQILAEPRLHRLQLRVAAVALVLLAATALGGLFWGVANKEKTLPPQAQRAEVTINEGTSTVHPVPSPAVEPPLRGALKPASQGVPVDGRRPASHQKH